MKKICPILRHAGVMVMRCFRSYAMLSVTILLSFSLLLGYLLYTDSSLYNENKELFSMRRGDLVITDNKMNMEKLHLLQSQLDVMPDTQYYVAYACHFEGDGTYYDGTAIGLEEGQTFQMWNVEAFLIPDHAWLDGMALILENYGISSEIVWLNGEPRESFYLAENEVILSEKVYLSLGMTKEENPTYTLHSTAGPTLTLNVVGYTKSSKVIDYSPASWLSTPPMLLSTKFIEAVDLLNENVWTPPLDSMIYSQNVVVSTTTPEEVDKLAGDMRYEIRTSVYAKQNKALESIRMAKGNKAIIACALFLLLGINLYSSFSNALNDRKFEIGVKRAMGASAWSIVRQFLYESMIVLIANIVISIAVVTDVAVLTKLILENTAMKSGQAETWVIYISPHSVGIFTVCTFTLTIVFSLIFAYKSTQVEIIRYLKAE